ncbi:MAG: carotenoid biosynthesis protein, partial [Anaerolineales bacterium]|nr:carotenoid biosynthesis protein [Anaerolineales bacterium]
MESERVRPFLNTVYRLPVTDYLSLTTTLILLWILAMISLPIMKWIWGPGMIPLGLTLGVLLQATAVLLTVRDSWGWPKTMGTAVIIAVLTLFVEWLGSTTGFPFGSYGYTDLMQPQIAHVPVLIPFAWFMMLPAAWAVARLVQAQLPGRWAGNRWLYLLLA